MSSEVFVGNPSTDDLGGTVFADFYCKWQNLYGEQGVLKNSGACLTSFAEYIPYTSLFDYDAASGRFKIRFFGSGYVTEAGVDLTDQFVDELPNTEALIQKHKWLVENKQPYLSLNNKLLWSEKDYRIYNVLGCPLFDAEGDVASLIFRIDFRS